MFDSMDAGDDQDQDGRGHVDELNGTQTLQEAAASRQTVIRVQVRQLMLAAHWADLHGVVEGPDLPGGERLISLGGDGTPLVAEFAPAELGAVLGVGTSSACSLIADALDLRHRLPSLWTRLRAGDMAVWVARQIAARTRRLDPAAAGHVDVRVAPIAGSAPFGRLIKVLDAAILHADPDQAVTDAATAAGGCGVFVSPDITHGHQSIAVRAAAPDVAAFDHALDVVSRAMRILGDPDNRDQRRARAVGVLAHPQTALDLVAEAETTRTTTRAAAAARRTTHQDHPQADTADTADTADGADPADGSATSDGTDPADRRRRCVFGHATLYVHLNAHQLTTTQDTTTPDTTTPHGPARSGPAGPGSAVVRVEDVGPVILDQTRAWLGHRHVTVKPVIDLPQLPSVDRYEIPPALAEAIHLLTPADCFPYSPNLRTDVQIDHTTPYLPPDNGGPPGQTRLDNLGPLGQRNHRHKTFSHWKVTQPRPGTYILKRPRFDAAPV